MSTRDKQHTTRKTYNMFCVVIDRFTESMASCWSTNRQFITRQTFEFEVVKESKKTKQL